MKSRSQIADKYKWDLVHMYSTDDKALQALKQVENSIDKLASFKGKLGNIDVLYDFLDMSSKLAQTFESAVLYFHLKLCEDVSSQKYNKIMGDIENLVQKMQLATAYEDSELMSYGDEYLHKCMNDIRFANYKKSFAELIRQKPHILDEKSNQIMANVGHFAGDFGEVFEKFDAVDIKFDDILDSKGKKHKLNNATMANYRESSDRVLRANAFAGVYKSFKAMANTIGVNYIAHVKADCAYTKIYNYNSTLEEELFDDNIPVDVYNKLVEQVNAHLPLLHKYYKIKKEILGLKDFTYHDSYVPLAKAKGNYPFDLDVQLTLKAVEPMGKKYVDLVKQELYERWVDVYPTPNKHTGGFENVAYGYHPYILLNNTGTLDDCFTFAHETGHALHSYFSNANQPYQLASYPIVLAEVASTTNEVFLLKYLYANAKTKREKLYYLDKYLKMFKSTIFRQTMFSEFEDYAHKMVESGNALTVKQMCDYYGDLNRRYHGKAIKHDQNINYEWLRIPHFYNSYYVYKYSTGLVSAICIASNILSGKQGALDNYYKYLSSGCSRYPLDTLKLAGVDLTTNEPYNVAFGEMEWALRELNKLK